MSIKLEISLGEAIDKLTIVDIKKDKIKDIRRKDVENEFDYLFSELKIYVNNYNYYYKILKKTNLEIWELQDILRLENSDKSNFYNICDEILNLNDSRYLVKKKINELNKSNLKEQKGYNLRILNIILNCNMDIINILNGAIRYYSFFYDEINLFSSDDNNLLIQKMFLDDPFIKINLLDKNANIKEIDFISIDKDEINLNLTHSYFKNNTNNKYDNKYSKEINDIYNKLGINISIFDEYKNYFFILIIFFINITKFRSYSSYLYWFIF